METERIIDNPRDVPEAHAIIRRLCALQAHVVTEVFGYADPADCFCGDEGFWPLESPDDYRNAGKAVEFIEEATLAAIKRHRERGPLTHPRGHGREPVEGAESPSPAPSPPAGPVTGEGE